jgi:hypothetical protein
MLVGPKYHRRQPGRRHHQRRVRFPQMGLGNLQYRLLLPVSYSFSSVSFWPESLPMGQQRFLVAGAGGFPIANA